jgi:octaprenyl-diphosphate synthase
MKSTLDIIQKPILGELREYEKLFLESLKGSNHLLNQALQHISKSRGKMMRPQLLLLFSKLAGGIRPGSLHAAVAMELLHTASLVHDDVVDESDERRGQPSLNSLMNNKVAVLVGDYLLSQALYHSALTRHIDVVSEVAQLGRVLSEGELLQLDTLDAKEIDEQVYFDVVRQKTSSLFSACCALGVQTAETDLISVEKARLFGEYIGICFQIRDDIFDYFDDASIGKPTGNDMAEGKLTLPVIGALKLHPSEEQNATALKVRRGEATPDEIASLVAYTKANGGMEYALDAMMKYKEKAMNLIEEFAPDTDVKASLQTFVEVVVKRTK